MVMVMWVSQRCWSLKACMKTVVVMVTCSDLSQGNVTVCPVVFVLFCFVLFVCLFPSLFSLFSVSCLLLFSSRVRSLSPPWFPFLLILSSPLPFLSVMHYFSFPFPQGLVVCLFLLCFIPFTLTISLFSFPCHLSITCLPVFLVSSPPLHFSCVSHSLPPVFFVLFPSLSLCFLSPPIYNNNNNNNNNHIQRRYSRFFAISSQRRKLSPTRTLKSPRRNRVQIMCNISCATCRVTCHLVRRDSSTIKFDRVENAFIWALFCWLNH